MRKNQLAVMVITVSTDWTLTPERRKAVYRSVKSVFEEIQDGDYECPSVKDHLVMAVEPHSPAFDGIVVEFHGPYAAYPHPSVMEDTK